jgi:hypothetical protein
LANHDKIRVIGRTVDFNLARISNEMFSQSTFNISINKGILKADCRRKDGTTKRSQIDLDRYIANDNGALVFRPDGNFSKTCTDITISDGILHCLAQQANGQFRQETQLDLNNFIRNNDGTLEWQENPVQFTRFTINNGVLSAESHMWNGSTKRSSLNLDDWIGNNDGQLVIQRDGGFSRSCSAITIENGILRCRASRRSGDEVPAELDLKQFIKTDNELQWIPDISSWTMENRGNFKPTQTAGLPTTQVPNFWNRCNPNEPHMSAFCAPSTSIR